MNDSKPRQVMESLALAHSLITLARQEWLEANDPRDGTDVVTPYDVWFYKVRAVPSCAKTVPAVPEA